MTSEVVLQTPRSSNVTSDRLHALASINDARAYLEVGVSAGDTFVNVTGMARKVAVDPLFRFDIDAYSDAATEYCAVTSDAYFETLQVDDAFDLIFLDGLHTFEQTYRDLTNALLHSHNRSIILIDDTLPSSAYSAIKDPAESVRARREAGITGPGPWHGDVFKTVFAIHDFHPGLNYLTLSDTGNPQTVVWRSKAFRREPLFNDFEPISRMDYEQLQTHMDFLRLASLEDAISQIRSSLS